MANRIQELENEVDELESGDEIADLRRQLENAKLSEGYALEAVANLHKEVADLREERDRLRGICFAKGAMLDPPCFNCGYNGPGYFNSDKHPCAAFHHAALIEWVQAPCTSPTCRGLKTGSPFMVTCKKGNESQALCNECFCK